MNHETPQQRRTRLIEQYVPQLLKLCQGEVMPPADQLINWASRLADAVIAATPQEPRDESRELSISDVHKAVWELSGVPDLLRGKSSERYPSEIETRLLELCEEAATWKQSLDWELRYRNIKRDMEAK